MSIIDNNEFVITELIPALRDLKFRVWDGVCQIVFLRFDFLMSSCIITNSKGLTDSTIGEAEIKLEEFCKIWDEKYPAICRSC
jgi:hypothetical protein